MSDIDGDSDLARALRGAMRRAIPQLASEALRIVAQTPEEYARDKARLGMRRVRPRGAAGRRC